MTTPAPLFESQKDGDIVCRRCSYNLRGINPDGCCPECGAPVALSLRGDQLECCDPRWVRGLVLGTNFFWVHAVLHAASTVGQWLSAMFFRSAYPGLALSLLAYASCLVAGWMLTRPEPGHTEDMTSWRRRMLIRMGLAASPVMIIIYTNGMVGRSSAAIYVATGLISSGVWVLWLVSFVMLLTRLRALAARASDYASVARLKSFTKPFVVLYSGSVVFSLATVLVLGLNASPRSGLVSAVTCVQFPLSLILIGFYLELARRVSILSKSFRRAARTAEGTWPPDAAGGQ